MSIFVNLLFFNLSIVNAAIPPVDYDGFTFIDYAAVPAGTNISVWGDCYGTGYQVVASTLTGGAFTHYYNLQVPIDDPATGLIDEGCTSGTTPIGFSVGGYFTYLPLGNISVGFSAQTISQSLYAKEPFYLGLPSNNSVTNDNTPLFNWTHGTSSITNFTLIIDDSSNMASPVVVHNNISTLSYTLNSSEALSANVMYYWRIDVYYNGLYNESSGVGRFTLDTISPTITGYSPANYSWRSTTPMQLNITTNENAVCKYDVNPSVAYATKTSTFAGSGTTAHQTNLALTVQGNNSIYIQCQDMYGNTNLSQEKKVTYRYDSVAPAPGSVSIANGATYSASTTLNFNWTGYSDPTSGISLYYYGFTNNQGTSTSDGSTPLSNAILNGAIQGVNSIYVWARDNVGNIGLAGFDSIIVDTANPVLSDWTENPPNLNEGTVVDFVISVRVTDTTWDLGNPPDIRYRYDSTAYTGWVNMTSLGGGYYEYTIPRPGGGWGVYVNDYLYYQIDAVDSVGYNTTVTRSKYINVFNNPPSLNFITDKIAIEKENFTFVITGTDLDGNNLTFSSNFNFSFIPISSNQSIAWWVPTNDDLGLKQVTFWVSDGFDNDSQTINIDVNPTNDPPVLNHIGNLNAYLHVPFTHYISGWDYDNLNNYTLDNNLLIFDIVQPYRWFRINSFFNVSNESYYGLINFTPLLSHKGSHNITLYVTDGTDIGTENLTFTVGYCGDYDQGGEPWCDADYESCASCETDCGKCNSEDGERLAIIIEPRNCLKQNFTIWTYKLYDRATCRKEGKIIEGYEVCGNISSVKVEVFVLENVKWTKIDEYISDDNGEITFVPTAIGEYKLIGTKRGYPTSFEYLEIRNCLGSEGDEKTPSVKKNETGVKPQTEKPTKLTGDTDTETGEIIPEASVLSIIIYYVLIPTFTMILIVLGYYYYEKEKNNKVWILKSRIWAISKRKIVINKGKMYYNKIKSYLGYGR